MKKTGVFAILFLLLFSLVPLSLAQDNETVTTQQSTDKVEDGFICLEEKAGDCSSLTTQELALTIMATPNNIFSDCVDELEDRQTSDNWGSVRDTALAILALKHAGKDTESAEEWLLEQEQIPTDLIWYMQQDSNEETECHIGYKTNDYTINVGINKKIDSSAGSCLTLAQSNFWLQVSSSCYEEEFSIECDQPFIANLLYKNKNSPTIYVLEGTESSPAFGSIKLEVNSKCFGVNSCDYEATAWATLALLKTGHNVEEFIPYVIAMADTNERYLPEAFIYMLTNYEDYATQLIANQKLGNYWEADSSAYNRFYDTSLALIALGGSSSEQIIKARDWLLFSQGSNGCWQNSVRDTAIALWALSGRSGLSSSGASITYCSEAGYFCIPSFDCPSSEDVGNNYFCASLSDTCCMNENILTCSEYGGEECSDAEVCIGNERKSTDISMCCVGTCEDRPQENECEANFYTCMDSCSEYQESMPAYSCGGARVCCRTQTTTTETSSSWWIWVLIVLIIAVLGAIGYIYRDKLKLLWFQIQTKFKKDDGKGGAPRGPRPGMPPRPGFPPLRRPSPPVTRMPSRPTHRDSAMSETFQKLKDMSR
ncbi:MAG: hypothetical protein ABIF18_00485 [archaeon]